MPEKPPKKEPNLTKIDALDVKLPSPGETFPVTVTQLGRTVASEIYGEEAENPEQAVLVVFFEGENGIAGKTPIAIYDMPSPRSKLFSFARKYGNPKVGMRIAAMRDENGYWTIAL